MVANANIDGGISGLPTFGDLSKTYALPLILNAKMLYNGIVAKAALKKKSSDFRHCSSMASSLTVQTISDLPKQKRQPKSQKAHSALCETMPELYCPLQVVAASGRVQNPTTDANTQDLICIKGKVAKMHEKSDDRVKNTNKASDGRKCSSEECRTESFRFVL